MRSNHTQYLKNSPTAAGISIFDDSTNDCVEPIAEVNLRPPNIV